MNINKYKIHTIKKNTHKERYNLLSKCNHKSMIKINKSLSNKIWAVFLDRNKNNNKIKTCANAHKFTISRDKIIKFTKIPTSWK